MLEDQFVRGFLENFGRSPDQINKLYEADAELIRPGVLGGEVLALTVDGLADEIQAGLYDDPYVIGWTAVNASLSDMAAVGAEPIGLLLQLQIPPGFEGSALEQLSRGIREACAYHHTWLLGGDTNHGRQLDVSITAIGKTSRPMLRKGCQPGDALFCSGYLGYGNAYAFAKIFQHQTLPYRPLAKIRQGLLIKDFAACCIDTSDGLFPALAQLAEVNPYGFYLETPFKDFIDATAASICASSHIPEWFMTAGPHGEYELLFTVSEKLLRAFYEFANAAGMKFLYLGRCREKEGVSFSLENRRIEILPEEIANIYERNADDPAQYFQQLQMLHQSWLQPQKIEWP